MAVRVVLDAGPLVALIDRDDQYNAWALDQTRALGSGTQLITCEAVIAEAYHLVSRVPHGMQGLLRFLEEGVLRLDFSLSEQFPAVASLMRKYQDVPMSLADACLGRMAERHDGARVFTLDSDFKFYRRHGRHSIPLIAPAP
jgi:predicted nucleic acid-binding protein